MTAIHAPFDPVTVGVGQAIRRGMVEGQVRSWLRLEGLAAFGAGLVLFGLSGGDWLFIVPLLLLPDLSMLGYLAGPRVGAVTYNLVHNWALGFGVLLIGMWLDSPAVLLVAGLLLAHIGMDRTLGYGLKMPSAFGDTHLGHIGKSAT
jgi:hypothetical protein